VTQLTNAGIGRSASTSLPHDNPHTDHHPDEKKVTDEKEEKIQGALLPS